MPSPWRATERRPPRRAAGRFDAQMIPVTVPGKRGKTTVVDRDECVRPESTMETLGRLPTAFEPDGVCTAGNSSPMSDGAGASGAYGSGDGGEKGPGAPGGVPGVCGYRL